MSAGRMPHKHETASQNSHVECETPVTRWFGPRFEELHPVLQQLHRRGGRLIGNVKIATGNGFSGWLGRRLAKSIGIPVDKRRRGFVVEIRHTDKTLDWSRRFDNGAVMFSRFEPVGAWPEGYWKEESGGASRRCRPTRRCAGCGARTGTG